MQELVIPDNLFQWYLDYQETDEFKQDAAEQCRKERETRRLASLVGSRRYRLKYPDAWKDREAAEKLKPKLFEIQHGLCHWCKSKLGDKYDVDHIKSYVHGGRATLDNLCVTCPHCNRSKSSKKGVNLYRWIKHIRKAI